mgnify:CR=1 FL=1
MCISMIGSGLCRERVYSVGFVSVDSVSLKIITSWTRGPIADSNPWRAMTLEWQVSSPPPIFNFDEIPQVVGGPYEYGVRGARHAIRTGGSTPQEAHA